MFGTFQGHMYAYDPWMGSCLTNMIQHLDWLLSPAFNLASPSSLPSHQRWCQQAMVRNASNRQVVSATLKTKYSYCTSLLKIVTGIEDLWKRSSGPPRGQRRLFAFLSSQSLWEFLIEKTDNKAPKQLNAVKSYKPVWKYLPWPSQLWRLVAKRRSFFLEWTSCLDVPWDIK